MAIKSIKETAKEVPLRAEEAFKSQVEYYRLFAFHFIAKSSYGLLNIFIFGLLCLLVLFFLSFAVSFAVGKWVNDTGLGFLIVGFFFVLVALIIFLFRKIFIEKPLLEKLSDIYFKDDDEDETDA